MKYIISGSNGALGSSIVKELESKNLKKDVDFIKGTRENFNIEDRDIIFKTVTEFKPDVIIHPAAYTQVDMCEGMEEYAMKVNGYGTKNIVDAAKEVGAKVIYTSSDYVFDGTKDMNEIYYANDKTNPLNVYGKSKLMGEEFAREYDKSFIVRTSWVYGLNGNNFVKTMLRLSETKDEISVVDDQVGSPTYTDDLAKLLLDMAKSDKYGTYNATNTGYISWAEFAEKIFSVFERDTKVNKISTEEYLKIINKKIAPRPKNSKLSTSELIENGFNPLPSYLDALTRYRNELEPKKNDNSKPKVLTLK